MFFAKPLWYDWDVSNLPVAVSGAEGYIAVPMPRFPPRKSPVKKKAGLVRG